MFALLYLHGEITENPNIQEGALRLPLFIQIIFFWGAWVA